MAAVTLKDLMDPLTKIQAATESTADAVDSLSIAIGTQIQGTNAVLQKLDKLVAAQTGAIDGNIDSIMLRLALNRNKLLAKIASGKGGGGAAGAAGGGKADKLKEGGEALKLLGAGASTLAKGMLIFSLVPKSGIRKFRDTLYDLFDIMNQFNGKKVKKAAEGFKIIADSIGTFAKNLVKATFLLPIGMIGIELLKKSLKMLLPTFEKLGKESKEIKKGSKALDLMGTSLLSFAKGLALAGLVAVVGIIAIPFLIISLILIGGAMLLLGRLSKPITKGAKALDRVGDALKSFGIGLAIFAITTFFIMLQPTILLGMVASLVLIGGAVALIGLLNKQINKGSLSLILMGAGLIVFGIGYAIFAASVSATVTDIKDVGMQLAVLGGIGLVTALLGVGLSLIAQGALSLVLMGLGLAVFGLGYIPFAKATKDATLDSVAVQAGVLTALGLVFAAAGLAAIAIVPGAVAFAAVGAALLVLAPGLAAMQSVNFTQEDALNLTTTLAGVKSAFIGPPNKGGVISGIFKSIGGAISGGADAVQMTAAAVGFAAAGKALTVLSVGLKEYKKISWTADDSLQLTTVLSGISAAFAQAGGEAAAPGGVFGAVFGNAFSPNATEKGIDSVMGAGKALTSIATGLTAFSALVKSKINIETLAEDIGVVLGFVSQAFAAIGGANQDVESGGFFSGLFGIKSTATEEGIRSVRDAGDALTGIAKGLEAFSGIKDPAGTAAKIGEVLGFVSQAFAAIGGANQDVESGGFFSSLFGIKSTATEEGIRSVKGAGDELVKIGTALEKFAGLKDPEDTAEKIKAVLGMVGTAFAAIGGGANEESDGNWFISWDENKIQKGIEAVDGAGDALVDIAAGLKAFSGDFQPEAVAASIGTLLTSIGTAFSDLYATNPTISPQLKDFSTFIVTLGDVAEKGLLDKAADGISKIADSINKIDIDKTVAFGDLFKSSSTLSEDKGAYKALAKAVEDIRDMMAETGGGGPSAIDKIQNAFDGGNRGAAPAAPVAAKGMGDMKKLNATLASLSQAITNLPGDIASAEFVVKLEA
jgi:hypothetical protein